MVPDDEKPDPKVKELLERDLGRPLEEVVDEITAAELQRWFGLPSFAQVDEAAAKAPASTEDPEIAAVRERRAQAIAAVDPVFLDAIHTRTLVRPETLIKFRATLDVHVDPSIARLDYTMIDRQMTIAEPRERERPQELEDDLNECAPQALLRDLHRVDTDFEKTFEIVDVTAEQAIDVVAAVDEAMRTSWKLPSLGEPSTVVVRKAMLETRAEIRAPWITIPSRVDLPNRRVSE